MPQNRLSDPRAARQPRRSLALRPWIVVLSMLAGMAAASSAPGGARAADGWADPAAVASTSACRVLADGGAAPLLIRLGESVAVRTRLRLSCRPQVRPYHLVIVVDAAATAAEAPGDWVPAAMAELAAAIDLASNPRARVGVVAFDSHARQVCEPTADPDLLDGCLGRLRDLAPTAGAFGGLAAAIDEAAKALMMDRRAAPPRQSEEPLREEIWVLTAAGDSEAAAARYCAGAGRAATEARAEGIGFGWMCLSGACDSACLVDAASPEPLEAALAWPRLAARYEGQVWSTRTRIRRLTLSETLPPQIQVDEASFDPSGAVHSAPAEDQTHRLRWELDAAGRDEIRLAYKIEPQAPGTWPIRLFGHVVFTDTKGETGLVALLGPKVAVVDGEPRRIHLPVGLRETPSLWQPFAWPEAH